MTKTSLYTLASEGTVASATSAASAASAARRLKRTTATLRPTRTRPDTPMMAPWIMNEAV